jgi:transposase
MSDDLPTDAAALRALLLQERALREKELAREQAAHERTRQQRDRYKYVLQEMIRRYFGRSSEKIDGDQLKLAFAAVEDDQALAEAEPPSPPQPPKAPRSPSQRRARRLEDLPLLETVVIDLPPEEQIGPDGTALVKIREEVTEEVDYQPGKLFRRRLVRIVYASPAHACPPRTAALPARVIPGGQVGPGLLAHVLLSKFVDHLPLYRQEQMLSRLGPTFTRQAMVHWVRHGTLLLQGVHAELLRRAKAGRYLQLDETPIALLDPERPGKARDAWLWAVHAPEQKIIVFEFHLTRGHGPPKELLDGFVGVLQTDGWRAYDTALNALPGHHIVRAGCAAHARRGFVKALEARDERATPFLVRFGELYAIEAELAQADQPTRERVRSTRSVPALLKLNQALVAGSADPAVLPKSGLGKAIHYTLARWPELTRFAEPGYGHLLIDNNPTERQIRPTKLGLKNWTFVGHPDAGDRPAVLYSVLGTCKLLCVDPWAYLNWALPGLAAASNHTQALFTPDRFPGRKA